MKKKNILVRGCMTVFLCFVLVLSTGISAFGTSGSTASLGVDIEAKVSKVANIYYEIYEDGEVIQEDKEFELVNKETGEIIDTITSEDGVIFIPNVDYGDYILRPVDGSGKEIDLKIDEEYLLEAHILKELDISPDEGAGTETGGENGTDADTENDEKRSSAGSDADRDKGSQISAGTSASAPVTGDDALLLSAVCLLTVSAGLLVLLMKKRREGECDEM